MFMRIFTEISPWINWDNDAAWAGPWICGTETGTLVDEVFSVLLVVGPNPFSALTVNAPPGNIMNIDNDKHEAIHKSGFTLD